ncbi:MAG: 16S rRNA (cytosine(1402)-N(4))-methyltransferase RsmH [Bacteroidales bacterium]|jgi:16S rRNA (cytosine1402-N4)-methyltransferase
MSYHLPVMLNESILGLNINPKGCYVDVTFGGGGHSKEILSKLNSEGKLIAFDQDEDALSNAIDDDRFILLNYNFKYLKNFLRYLDCLPVDGIIADLGISSYQIDTPEKGFSTRFDADLDMRMDTNWQQNAADVLNNYTEEQLADVFFYYGEIKNARLLSSKIVESRNSSPIKTVEDLKNIAVKLCRREQQNKYLAQVFQALRIEVNNELGVLSDMLEQAIDVLDVGGRLVVISYHSLEDRIVKNFIKSGNKDGIIEKDFYGRQKNIIKAVNKKPIVPSDSELQANPRSRSAKLRIAEKVI